jgi:hypothetical protein
VTGVRLLACSLPLSVRAERFRRAFAGHSAGQRLSRPYRAWARLPGNPGRRSFLALPWAIVSRPVGPQWQANSILRHPDLEGKGLSPWSVKLPGGKCGEGFPALEQKSSRAKSPGHIPLAQSSSLHGGSTCLIVAFAPVRSNGPGIDPHLAQLGDQPIAFRF